MNIKEMASETAQIDAYTATNCRGAIEQLRFISHCNAGLPPSEPGNSRPKAQGALAPALPEGQEFVREEVFIERGTAYCGFRGAVAGRQSGCWPQRANHSTRTHGNH